VFLPRLTLTTDAANVSLLHFTLQSHHSVSASSTNASGRNDRDQTALKELCKRWSIGQLSLELTETKVEIDS
jgi:hypothetical protein